MVDKNAPPENDLQNQCLTESEAYRQTDPLQIARDSYHELIVNRISDMTLDELVQLGNAITSIKRVSILTSRRQKG